MRILVCATEAPLEPLNGMRLQLRELSARLASEHEVCVLAFRWPEQHGAAPDGVELRSLQAPDRGAARRALDRSVSLARRLPVDVDRLARPMARALHALRAERRFDLVHVMLGELAGVASGLDGRRSVIAPLDAWNRNVAAAASGAGGPRRVWLRQQERLVRHYEARAYRPFARVVVVTEEDARELSLLDPSLRVAVIPNGVDAHRFEPDPGTARERALLVFTGALGFPPNAEAARRLALGVFPRVRARRPEAELALVGYSPGRETLALGERPGVTVVADAPDLRPWLRKASVFVCPMTSGTGIKNKLLEAMSCEAPCVVTPLALQGIDARDGRELLVAGSDEEVASRVLMLLDDRELARRVGEAARRHVVAHHDWQGVADAYTSLYREVLDDADRLDIDLSKR